eukprot:Gb_39418 [translate_table: standard]
MGFDGGIRNPHLLKRGRDGGGDERDLLRYCNCALNAGLKRRCCTDATMLNIVVGFRERFDVVRDEDVGITDIFTSHDEALREEVADSEVSSSKLYYDSDDFSPPFCRNSTLPWQGLPLPDDAQSSTADTYTDSDTDTGACDQDCDKQGKLNTENYISYLIEASDDDLGLPPPPPPTFYLYDSDVHEFHSGVFHDRTLVLDVDVPNHLSI